VVAATEAAGAAVLPGEGTAADFARCGYHRQLDLDASRWRDAAAAFRKGEYFLLDLLGVDRGDRLEVLAFYDRHVPGDRVKAVLTLGPENPEAPSIGDIFANARYYEREIFEFYGISFAGNQDLRYLFLHDGLDHFPLRKGKVPVSPEARARLTASPFDSRREDLFYLNMGPQHPSTHGVLRVVLGMTGEYVEIADPVVGYLHRMHEKMGENRTWSQFLPNTPRMDYAAAMTYNLAYVLAVERLAGIVPARRATVLRTITTELNRIASHMLWLGAYLADLGALTPFLYAFDDRENIQDVLDRFTGSRLTYCWFRFGGVSCEVDDQFVPSVRKLVDRMRHRLDVYEKLVGGNVIFHYRTRDVGRLTLDTARDYAVTGPGLRASGVPYDVRHAEPYELYRDLGCRVPHGRTGDALDRYRMRILDLHHTLDLVERALPLLETGPIMAEKVPKRLKPPAGDVYQVVESPRGTLGVYLLSGGAEKAERNHWRVPSFPHLMVSAALMERHLVADAVSIMGSFDLVIPEIDR
jgi:NADH-quinone oxidoreductase subunit D